MKSCKNFQCYCFDLKHVPMRHRCLSFDATSGFQLTQPLITNYFIGDFEEKVSGDLVTTSMNAFILGAGAGYKWEFSNFAFGPHVSVARGFSSEVAVRFSAIEINGGFSLGFRF